MLVLMSMLILWPRSVSKKKYYLNLTKILSFGCYSFIHIEMRFWLVRKVKMLQFDNLEMVLYDLFDIPIEMTAIADNLLQWCQAILPDLDLALITESMLYEKELSLRLENPIDFIESLVYLSNAAQSPSANNAIEAIVRHR